MPHRIATFLAVALLCAWPHVAAAQSLKVGDPAPKLYVSKWINGDPVEKFEKGKVYVIECWATWCGPCVQVIPHVSKLNTQYQDKDVVIIGMNVFEDAPDKVAAFIEDMGDKFNYRVALDVGGRQGKTATAWMIAAGRNGIPCTFVVDQKGNIAWIGHPLAGLDRVIEGVVAGTYDAKAEAARQQRLDSVRANLGRDMQRGQWDKALKTIDQAIATDASMVTDFGIYKFFVLLTEKRQYEAAYKYGQQLASKVYQDDSRMLNAMAWVIVDHGSIEVRNLDAAMAMASRAVELTERTEGALLDTLARVHFETKAIDEAIKIQKEAIAAETDPRGKQVMVQTLKRYEQAAKE